MKMKAFGQVVCLVLVMMAFVMTTVQADDESVDQKFQGFNLEGYTDEGEKSWDVTGDTADVKGTVIELSNIDANSYGKDAMNLKADAGSIDKVSGSVHLESDVVMTSGEGIQLETDSLDWYRDEDLVTTEDEVTITDERLNMSGRGLKAHPSLKTTKIEKNVELQVDTDPEKTTDQPVIITCDGSMEIDQATSVATFIDNVVVVQDDQVLRADKIEVTFDIEMKAIKKMVCTGNVEIEQGENKTYAQKAVYNAADQRLVLSGRPKLILFTEGENAIASFGN